MRSLRISITADNGPSAGVRIGRNDTNLAELVEWRIWIAPEGIGGSSARQYILTSFEVMRFARKIEITTETRRSQRGWRRNQEER
jgi:hypothetical protein